MSTLIRVSRFLLILVFFSGVSFSNAAAQPSGRLIVIGAANFGWNLAANLKIDGRTVGNVVQGRRYDHLIPAGRHVLTVSAVPNVELRQPTSITVNIRPGGNLHFYRSMGLRPRVSSTDDLVSCGDGETRAVRSAT